MITGVRDRKAVLEGGFDGADEGDAGRKKEVQARWKCTFFKSSDDYIQGHFSTVSFNSSYTL